MFLKILLKNFKLNKSNTFKKIVKYSSYIALGIESFNVAFGLWLGYGLLFFNFQ